MKNTSAEKTVIVTGASRGLGLGCVEELLKKGYRVVAAARDPKDIPAKLKALKAPTEKLITTSLDVSSEKSLLAFEKFLNTEVGRCDILVNNAGIYIDNPQGGTLSTSGEDLMKTLTTNLLGPYRMCQIVLPLMKKQKGGRIVNVSSGMGQLSDMSGGYPAYRISKTALNSLTRLLSREVEGTGILVNAVCPGWVKTDMGGPSAQRDLPEGVASILWAAYLPDNGPNGGYYRDGKELSW